MSDGAPVAPRRKVIPIGRLVEVERRILRVEHPPQIERELAKEWGITRNGVRRYITLVRKRLVDAFKATPPEEHAQRVEGMLLEAYRVALTDRDAKAMVAVAKTLAEVTGVKAPSRVDITSGGQPLPDVHAHAADLHARLAAAAARAARGADPGGAGADDASGPRGG